MCGNLLKICFSTERLRFNVVKCDFVKICGLRDGLRFWKLNFAVCGLRFQINELCRALIAGIAQCAGVLIWFALILRRVTLLSVSLKL